jgi:hypothetical protein
MKNISFLIFFLVCLNLTGQKRNLYQSSWYQSRNDEKNLSSEKYYCSEKGKLCYFISNDNDNVHLYIKVEDAAVQNRILKEGLTIWINMEGKKKKEMGVAFPLGSQNSGGNRRPDMNESMSNTDGTPVTPLSMANTIELIGFTGERERRFPSANADNFNGVINYDKEGVLHYKLVMPVIKLPLRNSRESDGAMPFAIGIEYGKEPGAGGTSGEYGPPPSSGIPQGGSRGGSRGGSGGVKTPVKGQNGSSSGSVHSTPPVSIWIKNIKLAGNR